MKIKAIKRLTFFFGLTLLSACTRPSQGQEIYTQTCNSCHMEDANGLAQLIPPIDASLLNNNRSALVCKVIAGINDSISGHFMPSYKKLTDSDLANVLNYIRSLKAEKSKAFTDKEVAEYREKCD